MDLKYPELAYWETALSGNIRVLDLLPYVSGELREEISKENDFTKQMTVFFENKRIIKDEMTEKEREGIPNFTIRMEMAFPNAQSVKFCIYLDREKFELNGEYLYNKWIENQEFRIKMMEENGMTTEEKLKNAFAERRGELTDFEEVFFGRLETQAINAAKDWSKKTVDELAEAFITFCEEKTHKTKKTEGVQLKPLIIL